MKPVPFNCKSAARKKAGGGKDSLLSSALLTYLVVFPSTFIIFIIFLSEYFSWAISCRLPPQPVDHVMFFWEHIYDFQGCLKWLLFSVIFRVCLPSYLSQCLPSCGSFLTPVVILLSIFISRPGSLWEPAYTINISWQHATSSPGPGQLWRLHLLSRPGWSNKACVMQPKPTTQQELSNAGSVRNWYEVLTEALFT